MKYDIYMHRAMRSMIQEIMTDVAKNGPEGDSHYMISFRTDRSDVQIPDFVRAKYPSEMTIVLQNQYDNLSTNATGFSVDLAFGGVGTTIIVPWTSITGFADPSEQWGIPLMAEETPTAPEGTAEVIDLFARRNK